MSYTYQYTDADENQVIIYENGGRVANAAYGHRYWRKYGVDVAVAAGEVLAHDYSEPTTVDEAYAAKYAEINAWRDGEYYDDSATVEVDGITYNADTTSQAKLEAYLAVSLVPEFWTDADNNDDYDITLETLQAIQTAILERGFGIHSRQRSLKTTLEELYATEDITADEIESLQVCYESEETTDEESTKTDATDDTESSTEDTTVDETEADSETTDEESDTEADTSSTDDAEVDSGTEEVSSDETDTETEVDSTETTDETDDTDVDTSESDTVEDEVTDSDDTDTDTSDSETETSTSDENTDDSESTEDTEDTEVSETESEETTVDVDTTTTEDTDETSTEA